MDMHPKVEARLSDLARGETKRKRKGIPLKRRKTHSEGRDDVRTPTDIGVGDVVPVSNTQQQQQGQAVSREGSPAAVVPQPTPTTPSGTGSGATATPAAGGTSTDEKPPEERERSRRRQSRRRENDDWSSGPCTPNCTLEELGGVDEVMNHINELVGFPLAHPELFQLLGTEPISGILLHGPPGCGKTRLCHAVAHALNVPFFALNAPEVVTGVSGDSEARLRALFTEASAAAPSLILLDEVDAIAGKRDEAGRAMETRIVAQLQTCMDSLGTLWRKQGKAVIVMGATNRPEVIEPALRRSGRFDREISLGIPSLEGREQILRVLTRTLRTSSDVDIRDLSFDTPGFVGADLHAVVKEAALMCMKDIRKRIIAAHNTAAPASEQQQPDQVQVVKRIPVPEDMNLDSIALVTQAHFKAAISRVQPSSMREGFSTIPDVQWEDVGALEEVREEMELWVLRPIRHPELYSGMGLGQPSGLLLFGPPGCGKTLVAKAIAHEASANFISVKGPELLNKYVGESERAVRMVFARARASAPCVLFFDELDSLAQKRGSDKANPGAERLVNQLLTELDGVEGRKQVYVIAATNRVDMIDRALMRPGRFDKTLYVPLPTAEQRVSVLQKLCRRTPLAADVNIQEIAAHPSCKGLSGADLKGLVREASMSAVRNVFASGNAVKSSIDVTKKDFELALQKVRPSVSEAERVHYESLWRENQSLNQISS
eukprot:TRINITY_DN3496_c2_g1_i2.p1 TRINITY_DN3496_c2_g1~~TRINITY_DN3496_c2_g1_i2.p1  ORF type:complete len:717 (+),score=132.60 TRINITY_DN3496_c2_g1_i2:52-2202(+)